MKSTTKLGIVLVISGTFMLGELAIGIKTRSLALIADAFHYASDLFAYLIAFIAAYLKAHGRKPPGWTYGWHRAELVGAFFNGVFLLGLALSIFLQSLERFANLEKVEDPLSVMIVGAVGLALNIVSAAFVHDHGGHGHGGHSHGGAGKIRLPEGDEEHGHAHSHGHEHEHADDVEQYEEEVEDLHELHNHVRLPPPIDPHGDLGLLGVLIHVLGDAINNIGVIIVGYLIYRLDDPRRYYADPAASLIIALIIFASAVPLTLRTARILLEAAPAHLDLEAILQDITSLPNVLSVHDAHLWHLSQSTILMTVHVRVPASLSLKEWHDVERRMRECLAAYGINHVTIEVEAEDDLDAHDASGGRSANGSIRRGCRTPGGSEVPDALCGGAESSGAGASRTEEGVTSV